MNRPLKLSLIIIGAALGLIILLWLAVATYVATHKNKVLEVITTQLNENIQGVLTIESMEPSLIKGFPGISVSLKNVLLRDSLYERHKHDLLKAENVFISVNAWSFLSGNPSIQTLEINKGEIYLYTDSLGNKNSRLLTKSPGSGKKTGGEIRRINLNNTNVTMENRLKGKFFSFVFHKLRSDFKYKTDSWKAVLKFKADVKSLTFNHLKGSFIKGKKLASNLTLQYNKESHVLTVPLQDMFFDSDRLKVGGNFSFALNNSSFTLRIKVPNILFKNARSLLTPKILRTLGSYNLKRPFAIDAVIRGRLGIKNIPLINVVWNVKNNQFVLPGEQIEDCSFSGRFSNELEKGKPRQDPNSILCIYKLKGKWSGIDFSSDSIKIWDLKQPIVEGRFYSDFSLSKLNAVSGSETFNIKKGRAKLDLLYKAPFNQSSKIEPYIFGSIRISNAELLYVPRNLRFRNVEGKVSFKGPHLYLENMQIQSASSKLMMKGSVLNFLNFYYTDPKRILLDWKVQSEQIDLTEFLAFLGTRKAYISANHPSGLRRIFRQLNSVLNEANVQVDLKAKRLVYKKFIAEQASSNLRLSQTGINIENVSLYHGGGGLKIRGRINQGSDNNKFAVDATLTNVDIRKLFYAFNNFGQSGITYENLRGKLTARAKVNGLIKNTGQTVPKSFYGNVQFNLKQGALVNYTPMEEIGSFAFPKRNFSNITFNNLHNTLGIQGNRIIIPRMIIQSSVLNLIVEGVYGIPTGTNISLSIPLRNPEKDALLPDSLKEKRMKKGIVINLNAVDGEDGSVKFKLGKGKND